LRRWGVYLTQRYTEDTRRYTEGGMEEVDNLERTIEGFGTIQSERNYQQAQDTLRQILVNLDLSQRERFGLDWGIAWGDKGKSASSLGYR
jgi:hypothetical protein